MNDLAEGILGMDPRRFDRVREDAAQLGHVVERARVEGNSHRNRWGCSCGMYGITDSPQDARDESINHLRGIILDAKLAR